MYTCTERDSIKLLGAADGPSYDSLIWILQLRFHQRWHTRCNSGPTQNPRYATCTQCAVTRTRAYGVSLNFFNNYSVRYCFYSVTYNVLHNRSICRKIFYHINISVIITICKKMQYQENLRLLGNICLKNSPRLKTWLNKWI